ncbi:hypothetical protein LX64_04718 [Chitinophaga skermanii]|uniref:DUF6268 domain-containing protein n=1 Tax=Chitinophaga skermanii TaxID=331697 RepID=A0A327Q446_9BACT|nr:DUF6268 family outer membrane beta-barrel protein [Chitinophaga skermanii]RAI98733.1 hypothetical protein LX64_04718 [Chitinophaga skermanii]
MKLSPCLLLVGVLLLFSSSLFAQAGPSLSGPGISFQADYLPATHYIRPEDSVKMPANSSTRRYSGSAFFQLSSNIDTATGKVRIWNLGMEGSYLTFNNQLYEKSIMPKELAGGSIGIQHIRNLRNNWSLMAMLSAGVYTDMEAITYNDVFINGGVIFIKQHNKRFSYGIGGVLTNTFGTPMILPALMVKYKTNSKIDLQIAIPEGIRASYRVHQLYEAALALRLNGGSYDIENRPDNERLMAYREVTTGIENTLFLTRFLSLNVSGGAALLRSVDYRSKSISNIFSTKPEHRLATGWYVNAGIRFHFKPQ